MAKIHPVMEICRLKDTTKWVVVANPTDRELNHALFWLDNLFNEYVEYSNEGGTITRYIRREDWPKYKEIAAKEAVSE